MTQSSKTMKYPIGIQDFESLIKDGYLYIDKTALIYKLVTTGRYYFLSRPRRFGKSLLVSTLKAYFEGKKELFKGLAIEQLEKDWTCRPVFHLDLNLSRYGSKEDLLELLNIHLKKWEQIYGANDAEIQPAHRFAGVIERAHKQSGERVAILIDEYDKPLVYNIDKPELQTELRENLRTFYSVIKTKDADIMFGLLTGVSKFGKLSIFSDLNSPEEISLSLDWATICGISEEEILKYLMPGIDEMAQSNDMTREETLAMLKQKYDGYHFHPKARGVYNPYSLLNALKSREFGDYWFETGTPTMLVKLLKQTNYDLNALSSTQITSDKINSVDVVETNPIPLLFQSGYLTIKGFDKEFRLYELGFPNQEVENGFVNYLLPVYFPDKEDVSEFFVKNFVKEIRNADIDSFMSRLQTLYDDNSYTVQGKKELYFQNTMFIVFKLLGFYVDVERTTSRGRIDMVIKTKDYIYVVEIKYDGTPAEALAQIEKNGYAKPYAQDPRQLYKIGINFSSEARSIDGWKVEE